ncbi:MAG: hypothetical protein K0R39_5052 [Symbiobacteriaceae bacterium]|jgi:hypothetical protein|nr:hypothetical protein [Symbiobacteriaceae bacterium]
MPDPHPNHHDPEHYRHDTDHGALNGTDNAAILLQDATDPNKWPGGDLTYVAVFEDLTGARSCADDLERRGWDLEITLLPRREDGPEQGTRPGNVITGRGYGLSAENQSPPRNIPMGSGVVVGATLGATVGWLTANYVLPGFAPLVATGGLIATLTGAGVGAFLGGLSQYTVADQQDDATLYAGQARRGGVIMLVRIDEEDAERVRKALEFWEPLEIRVQ